MKITDINVGYAQSHSCKIGSINCSYEKLCLLFGEPKEIACFKTDYEWTLILNNGDHINIYDWKIGKSYCGEDYGLDGEDITHWNVGSNNPNTINILNNLINAEDWGGFEELKLKMFMSNKLVKCIMDRI